MFDLVILAGGKGTRLKKKLNGLPKPLVKINNIHFLDYLLFKISKFFFANIYIISGYRGSFIKTKYHNKTINLTPIKVIKEKKLKGTGGALFEIKKLVKNDFFLINADTIFDINFYDLIKNFNKKKYIGCIALVKSKTYQENKKLNSLFIKKNTQLYLINSKKSNYMNGGVYFFKKNFLEYIKNKKSSLENDILPSLIKSKKICGKFYNNYFLDIGLPKNLIKAKKDFKKIFFKPAIFLDRDGTINCDKGYTYKSNNLKLIKKQ
jgi:NDP-sugar pyrophosphorylase family protein